MTFLRRSQGQSFLAARKDGAWSFPCEVTEVLSDGMVVKQYIPEGSEEDFLEPEFKDTLIRIILEPEILEFVYLYMSIKEGALTVGECILRRCGIGLRMGDGIWIKLLYFPFLFLGDGY